MPKLSPPGFAKCAFVDDNAVMMISNPLLITQLIRTLALRSELLAEKEATAPEPRVMGAEVARRLGLSAMATSRCIRAALDGGWLRNHSKGKRQALTLGDPLPLVTSLLSSKPLGTHRHEHK